MGLRQRLWAVSARRAIVQQLGGACSWCGSRRKLEFDCIRPRGHFHHRMEWSWRLSFYRRELAAGNLQLLCRRCHGEKTAVDTLATRQAACVGV